LKIAILQADAVLEQFQPKHGNYPLMIADLLRRAADRAGLAVEMENFAVFEDEYPVDVSDFDGYVISGSRKSVYDDEPWISRLGEFVRLIHTRRIKLVGICFGHQLIAEALGGKTMGADVGWGVGIHDYDIKQPAWFMAPGTESFSLIVSHQDQVVDLPDGAVLLAGSSFCPNSLYTIEDHILAMQGHPEFSREYSRDLIQWREEILGPEKYAEGLASLENELSEQQVGDWIIRFLRGAKTYNPAFFT